MLLRLNLRLKNDAQSTIDFEHYSMLFDKKHRNHEEPFWTAARPYRYYNKIL